MGKALHFHKTIANHFLIKCNIPATEMQPREDMNSGHGIYLTRAFLLHNKLMKQECL